MERKYTAEEGVAPEARQPEFAEPTYAISDGNAETETETELLSRIEQKLDLLLNANGIEEG